MLFGNIYNIDKLRFWCVFYRVNYQYDIFAYSLKVLILLFDILYMLCYDTSVVQDSKTIYIFLGGCYHVR